PSGTVDPHGPAEERAVPPTAAREDGAEASLPRLVEREGDPRLARGDLRDSAELHEGPGDRTPRVRPIAVAEAVRDRRPARGRHVERGSLAGAGIDDQERRTGDRRAV